MLRLDHLTIKSLTDFNYLTPLAQLPVMLQSHYNRAGLKITFFINLPIVQVISNVYLPEQGSKLTLARGKLKSPQASYFSA